MTLKLFGREALILGEERGLMLETEPSGEG